MEILAMVMAAQEAAGWSPVSSYAVEMEFSLKGSSVTTAISSVVMAALGPVSGRFPSHLWTLQGLHWGPSVATGSSRERKSVMMGI